MSSTLAHNGEPAPSPPSAPRAPRTFKLRTEEILPPRWSWIHWWEANRERYLHAPAQSDRAQDVDTSQQDALRSAVAAELIGAIKSSGNALLQAKASLALGKLRHAESLPVLSTLASGAPAAAVRTPAVTGIGLLGSRDAEAALVAFEPGKRDAHIAAVAAIGLLRDIQPENLRQLRAATDDPDPALATVACWALRQHHSKLDTAYYLSLLDGNESPWVACEALLALGSTRDRAALPVLEDILLGEQRAGADVKAWDAIRNLRSGKPVTMGGGVSREQYEENFKQYERNFERWRKRNPNGKGELSQRNTKMQKGEVVDLGTEVMGPEEIQLAGLRASAAIALGELQDPRAARALLSFIEPTPAQDPYLVMPRQFAVMALAAYPDEAARDRWIHLLGKRDERGNLRIDGPQDGTLRGFAALALGLYAQPYDTAQGPADRVGFDWAISALAERLEDPGENQELRSACAIGLGLAQRTAVLPVLHRVSAELQQRGRRQDVSLYGHTLLARAMAGDQNVIEPAAKFLATEDDPSPNGILGRRAAVLSLGMTGSSGAIPVLTKAWHLNHYVNREVILALRLIGGTSAATPLMKRLRESKDDEERAYMAEALGELLAPEHPTPLTRLIAQSNYTIRNDNLLPLQRMANGFLFDFLIASFGEDWF